MSVRAEILMPDCRWEYFFIKRWTKSRNWGRLIAARFISTKTESKWSHCGPSYFISVRAEILNIFPARLWFSIFAPKYGLQAWISTKDEIEDRGKYPNYSLIVKLVATPMFHQKRNIWMKICQCVRAEIMKLRGKFIMMSKAKLILNSITQLIGIEGVSYLSLALKISSSWASLSAKPISSSRISFSSSPIWLL